MFSIQNLPRFAVGAYLTACAASFFLIASSMFGWFGVSSDPLSGLYAVLLASPWLTTLVMTFDSADIELPFPVDMLLMFGSMALNATIIWFVTHLLVPKKKEIHS